MIMADIVSIIVSVFVRFFAEWLSGQILTLFGVSSTEESS